MTKGKAKGEKDMPSCAALRARRAQSKGKAQKNTRKKEGQKPSHTQAEMPKASNPIDKTPAK